MTTPTPSASANTVITPAPSSSVTTVITAAQASVATSTLRELFVSTFFDLSRKKDLLLAATSGAARKAAVEEVVPLVVRISPRVRVLFSLLTVWFAIGAD